MNINLLNNNKNNMQKNNKTKTVSQIQKKTKNLKLFYLSGRFDHPPEREYY